MAATLVYLLPWVVSIFNEYSEVGIFILNLLPGVDRYRMDYCSNLDGHEAATTAAGYCLSECTALPNSTAAFGQF